MVWGCFSCGAQPENNIIQKVNKLRKWRQQMAMPPRAADLWQANSDLQVRLRQRCDNETPSNSKEPIGPC